MRSWSCQRMQSSTGTSASLRVRSSQCSGWTDSVFMRPRNPLRGGVVRGTALGARRPCQAVAVHERQPSGSPAVAIRGRNAPGDAPLRRRLRGPDEHPAGERPRRDRNRPCMRRSGRRGSRPAARGTPFPSPALIPGDVRGPFPVRYPSREIAVGEVAGSRQRLPPVRQAPQVGARVFFCEPPPPPASPRSPVPAPRPCGATPPHHRRRPWHSGFIAPLACRTGRRSCFWAATRPCRPHDTP